MKPGNAVTEYFRIRLDQLEEYEREGWQLVEHSGESLCDGKLIVVLVTREVA